MDHPVAVEQCLALGNERRGADVIGRLDVILQRAMKLLYRFLYRLHQAPTSPFESSSRVIQSRSCKKRSSCSASCLGIS